MTELTNFDILSYFGSMVKQNLDTTRTDFYAVEHYSDKLYESSGKVYGAEIKKVVRSMKEDIMYLYTLLEEARKELEQDEEDGRIPDLVED